MARGGKRPGAGRKKGVPNKLNAKLKDAILNAFHTAGGEEYLVTIAKDDPKTFCALLGRVLPTEVKAEVSGHISYEDMSPEDRRRRIMELERRIEDARRLH